MENYSLIYLSTFAYLEILFYEGLSLYINIIVWLLISDKC